MPHPLDRTEVDQTIALALAAGATVREVGLTKGRSRRNTVYLDVTLRGGEEFSAAFHTSTPAARRLGPAGVTRKNPGTGQVEGSSEDALRARLLRDGGTTGHDLAQLLETGKAIRAFQPPASPVMPDVTTYAPV